MFVLSGWAVEQGLPLSSKSQPQAETLRWQDPATPLCIWQVGALEEGIYRLSLGSDLVVDTLPDRRIVTRPRPDLPQITIDHFLADQVFPRLLAHAGSLVVHAGAVRVGNAAVMLMGSSGRGKSTLSASFDQAGFELVGDDAMIVSSAHAIPRVRPVYPSLRLFPDSIDALMLGATTAGPVAHYSNKQRIDVGGVRGADDFPLPIHALFSIAGLAEDDRIALRRLPIAESCMTLVENSFALDPSDIIQARRRLDDASALARRVPTFEITYPRDYARLPDVRQAILDQIASLEPA